MPARFGHAYEVALIERINEHRRAGRGTDAAPASVHLPVDHYTSPDRLEAERRVLHSAPTIVGLSALVPEPGAFATVDVGDRSVIVTRQSDGSVAAMHNVCRHRGAELTSGCGTAQRLTCPYHGWTYHLDGRPAARRRNEYFDDVDMAPLVRLPVLESDGLIWVSADPEATIPDRPLQGAEVELAPLDLARHRRFASTSFRRPLNWKLAVDTFTEAYHVPSLHRTTLAPMIHGDFALFDAFGGHGRLVSARRSIDALVDLPVDEWALLPHATILWYLLPNTVLIHQQDHVQLYRSRPGSTPDEAVLDVSLYVPLDSTRSDAHWQRNFELLVSVTDSEDFTTAAGIQRGYHSGAQTHVVQGRNEPALQHFHRALDAAVSCFGHD